MDQSTMEYTTQEILAARAIGFLVLRYLRETPELQELIAKDTNILALRALDAIRKTVNDEALGDPECFQKIERVLNVLEDHGIDVTRHDW